jgi:tellurite methyltransferase
MENRDEKKLWMQYYKAVTGRAPRPLLLEVVARFQKEANGSSLQAIDLGCGDGTETFALLEAGWKVIAVDKQEAAIERVRAKTPTHYGEQLETRVADFETVTLPSADLIHAGFSLPFCPPAHFAELWSKIETSLGNGGRFAGQLFGDRDSWATNPEMTFHSLDSARDLFKVFDIETFKEEEEDGKTALGDSKHWHIYHIIAKRKVS